MNTPYMAPYYYGSRTTEPYPEQSLDRRPIGYAGSFGTGAYALGGGYYNGQSYLTRPITGSDLLLQSTTFAAYQGYPYYSGASVLGQMRPEWWLAQRRAFAALESPSIPLEDNRPPA